jgi:hypothetical protein
MFSEEDFKNILKKVYHLMILIFSLFVITGSLLIYYTIDPTFSILKSEPKTIVITPAVEDENRIENGIHVRTGFIDAEGLMTVVNNCTNCHSSKIILQNRMNAERWNATIKWMQETQNLWGLGDNQDVIVKYLVANYPPKAKGRREILSNIDWYELEN